jgi:hypothetical protein
VVFVFAVVGPVVVLQHTPLAVTGEPPSFDKLPPLDALFVVMAVTDAVEIFALAGKVVNVTSSPYEVPAPLIA